MALERNLDRARRGLEQAEVQAKQAESYLDQLLARQNRTVQEIAQAHRNVDRARAKLDQIRPAYESAEDAMDEFRDGVLSDCGDMR
jgi:chromosome segregation ATPase